MTNVKRYLSYLTLQMRLDKSLLCCTFAALAVSQLGIIIFKLLSIRNQANASGELSDIPYFYYQILEQGNIDIIFLVIVVVTCILYSYRKVDKALYHVPIPFSIQFILQFIFYSILIIGFWMYEFFILTIGAGLYEFILPNNLIERDIIANTMVQSNFIRSCYPITNMPRLICVLCTLISIAMLMTYMWGELMLDREDFLLNLCIPIFVALYNQVMKGNWTKPEYIALIIFGLTLIAVVYCCTSLWYYWRKENKR